jgi:hypothetical protein
MTVLDLQEMPLLDTDGEKTVLPGNDALVIPCESNLSVALCPSALSVLLCC